jgi:hypothetical protein
LHQGGKSEDPQELTQVSDWGEQTQPTQDSVKDEVKAHFVNNG